ncbi:hypothetical protein DD237_004060 [Peronospora effusa]|uniref:Uncharacterized protein n=1 Tax=Peronospora effusa TaxID=542832 RepID=A0A3R7XWW3_9STRA|nr:hypothetical protein DD237_004060 [Peronospora effusa]
MAGLKETTREVRLVIEPIQRLVDAANKLIAKRKERLKGKRTAYYLFCVWRQTGQYDSYNKREPRSDLLATKLRMVFPDIARYTGEAFCVMKLCCSSLREHVIFFVRNGR